jgi:hypothetical protein
MPKLRSRRHYYRSRNHSRNRNRNQKTRKQSAGARFFHYSAKPIHKLRDLSPEEVGKLIMKPNGLWLSEEDSWKEWCNESCMFNLSKAYKYEATVDISKLYIVDSIESLNTLQKEYYDADEYAIKWAEVAKKYAGIQFTNYIDVKNKYMKQFSPESIWFMGVDIDSVCIWKPSEAIVSFTESV